LETLGALRTLAFDKTGTITKGSPVVTDVIPSESLTEDEILALAAAVERRSAHPLAYAIVEAASHLDLPKAENVQEQPGMGLRAMIEGRQVYVGNLNRESLETGPVPQELLAKLSAFEVQGKTVVSVGLNGRMIGLIAVADALRPEAGPAVEALRTLGIDPLVMLTGDRSRVAEHIAHQVGIQEVYANLMPAEKLEAIYKLSKAYKTVGMVGDGVNDAPALAAANIGIAMGGAKTGVALETADIVLMADDLSKLPFAVGLGRQAKKTIQQNMAIAIGVMAVLVGLTLANLAGITLAIVLHESSTLIVVFNALRLLQFKDPLKA
jgi:Cd2+/Zn2+-exporting ATPase